MTGLADFLQVYWLDILLDVLVPVIFLLGFESLNEMSILMSRVEVYWRFVIQKFRVKKSNVHHSTSIISRSVGRIGVSKNTYSLITFN